MNHLFVRIAHCHLILLFVSVSILFACSSPKTDNKREENQNQTIESLTASIANDSTNSGLYHQRAMQYLADGKFEPALSDLNRALQLDGRNQDFFLTLAEVYLRMGQPEACNNALQQAINLDATNPVPLFKMAELYYLMGDRSTAMMYADRSLHAQENNPDALFVKAMIYLANADTLNAIKSFQLSLNQKEAFFEPLMQLGIVYSAQRNALAEQYLTKAIRLFPEEYKARYQLALFLQENNKVNEALLHYDTLLQKVPENKFVLFNMGYLHLVYLASYEKAIQYFDEALLSDPNYVDALYNKGRAMEELGQFENAREVYQEVLRRQANHQLAIDALNRLDIRR